MVMTRCDPRRVTLLNHDTRVLKRTRLYGKGRTRGSEELRRDVMKCCASAWSDCCVRGDVPIFAGMELITLFTLHFPRVPMKEMHVFLRDLIARDASSYCVTVPNQIGIKASSAPICRTPLRRTVQYRINDPQRSDLASPR